MSDFIDHLPSHEQQKLRKRMRSAAEYERLREKVKGPEDLERELERSDRMADLHFSLESHPETQEKMRQSLETRLSEDVDAVVEHPQELSAEARLALKEGRFAVKVGPHPKEQHDVLLVIPEGNVQEKVAVKPALSDQLMSQLVQSSPNEPHSL